MNNDKAVARKAVEVAYWEQWKNAPQKDKPELIKPLLQAYAPTFNAKTQIWKPNRMPVAVFQAHLHNHFIDALNTYNPEKAALSTHVEKRLKKVLRDVAQSQNFARIPEGQTRQINLLASAQEDLHERLGRPPTRPELAQEVGLSQRRVNTILTNLRRDVSASKLESDPNDAFRNRQEEVIGLIRAQPELYFPKPIHRDVFMHIYNEDPSKRLLSTNSLAKKLDTTAPVISRSKTFVLETVRKFL